MQTQTLRLRGIDFPVVMTDIGTRRDLRRLPWLYRFLYWIGLTRTWLARVTRSIAEAERTDSETVRPFFLSFDCTLFPIKHVGEFVRLVDRLRLIKSRGSIKTKFGVQLTLTCSSFIQRSEMRRLFGQVRIMLDILAQQSELDDVPFLLRVGSTFPTEVAALLDRHPRLDGWVALVRSGPTTDMQQDVKDWFRLMRRGGATKPIVFENCVSTIKDAFEMIEHKAAAIVLDERMVANGLFRSIGLVRVIHLAIKERRERSKTIRIHAPQRLQTEPIKLALNVRCNPPDGGCVERETAFLKGLDAVLRDFPDMPVVLEDLMTKRSVAYVRLRAEQGHKIAGTITLQRLVDTRWSDQTDGCDHTACRLRDTDVDREALIEAATSGDTCFFCDPGPIKQRNARLPEVARIFEEQDRLDRLEAFISRHQAWFHGLSSGDDIITLAKQRRPIGLRTFLPWSTDPTLEWHIIQDGPPSRGKRSRLSQGSL